MSISFSYRMNTYMEIIVLVFMVFLLIFCLSQRKEQPFLQKLNHMVLVMTLILLVQIAQWQLGIQMKKVEITPFLVFCKKVLFVSDYSLLYFFDVTFYCYLTYYIEYWRIQKGDMRKFPHGQFWLRIGWGIFLTVLFSSSIWTGAFYQFDAYGVVTASRSYLWPLCGSFLCSFFNAVITVKNRKTLSLRETILMITYFLLPLPLIVIDLMHDTCYGYIMKAFTVFIIFLGIDLYHGHLILKQNLILSEQKEVLTRQRMTLMLSQIQPHFLYNTLSVIDYLCIKDPKQARKVIGYFSKYLRTNIDSMQSDVPIPFEKELSHVQGYLWIEQVRYGDKLSIEYDIKETNFKIPPLTLQPLVENAVKYGVRSRQEGGTLTISTRRDNKTILIQIKDNGMGFDPKQTFHDGRSHIGIRNVRERIEMLCAGELLIDSSPGNGTVATIRMEEKE